MRVYWDTSALVRYFAIGSLDEISGVTRTHSLVELFSTLTGRGYSEQMKSGNFRQRRLSMVAAASVVTKIRSQLEIVDLTTEEVLFVMQRAEKVNAQGGRIHDLMHAAAADKAKADEFWTLDQNDFSGLGNVLIKQL